MHTKTGVNLDELKDWELRQLGEQIEMEKERRIKQRLAMGKYIPPEITGNKLFDLNNYHAKAFGSNRKFCEAVIEYEYEKLNHPTKESGQ